MAEWKMTLGDTDPLLMVRSFEAGELSVRVSNRLDGSQAYYDLNAEEARVLGSFLLRWADEARES